MNGVFLETAGHVRLHLSVQLVVVGLREQLLVANMHSLLRVPLVVCLFVRLIYLILNLLRHLVQVLSLALGRLAALGDLA
jgi:hypothetical protein